MEKEELELLREMSRKLDLLVTLMKLSNRDVLERFRNEVKKDKVATKILELANEPITYSDLVRKVSTETGTAEITVKRKISRLKEMGFLMSRREGREVYYENTGLIE
mgnify:FL=1